MASVLPSARLKAALQPQAVLSCFLGLWQRFPRRWRLRSNTIKLVGYRLAEQIYRQILQVDPDHAEALHLLGVINAQTGNHQLAAEYMHRVLMLKPDYAAAHYNLGDALMAQGKPAEAAACYRRALELKPDFADAQANLGAAFMGQGKPAEAIACYRRALDLKPDFAAAHNNLGDALLGQGKPEEAAACHRRALDLKPDFAEAYAYLGTVVQIGDLQGAEDRSAPRSGTIPGSPSRTTDWRKSSAANFREQDLAAQRRLLEDTELTDPQRVLLQFAVAQVLDARGEYAAAAGASLGPTRCRLSEWRRLGQEYDPQEYAVLITRMIEVCTSDFFGGSRGFGLESEVPVFVVGLPRSGTTLIEQILASHSQVFGAGEIKLAHDTMAALGGPGGDPVEGLRRLDRQTAGRLAARHLEDFTHSTARPFASWTRCRRTTCIWACWRACFRGRSSFIAAAICATWPFPAG